ncbi:TPA: DUF1844 domain-containing protein [Candidatus Poribacteria bacterium]|nr:DUF1844 domain-containing protein [Candidatus Poribacteria bacterium]
MTETQKPTEEETQESKQEDTQKSEQEEPKETPEKEKIELPPVDFTNFINSLASTAFMYMGGVVDPETKKPIIELNLAKHQIDIIEMLQQKTKGNLTAPENNFLENTLYNLRMSYVRLATAPPPTEEPKAEQSESNAQNEKDGEQKN